MTAPDPVQRLGDAELAIPTEQYSGAVRELCNAARELLAELPGMLLEAKESGYELCRDDFERANWDARHR